MAGGLGGALPYSSANTVTLYTKSFLDTLRLGKQSRAMMPPRPPLTVVKLSNHGGQYVSI